MERKAGKLMVWAFEMVDMVDGVRDSPPPVDLDEEDMNELKEVIIEFLALNRYLYHKRVQKLVFAGDILAAQKTGHRLTDASFCPYTYGPYSRAVEEALGRLVDEGRVTCNVRPPNKKVYRTKESGGELSPRKKHIVKSVWENYKGVPTADIVEDVKDTWVYEQFDECEEIDFTKFIDECVRPPDTDIPNEKKPLSEDETRDILTL